jgi:GntR family transcriptional regulator, galactonate operon transcriptional repressor
MIRKLASDSLTEQFVRSFADIILKEEMPPGTQIPSEAEIAREFGVSRTVVREGIRELTVLGLLIKKQGRCSMVAPRETWDMLNPQLLATMLTYTAQRQKLLDDLFDTRLEIEAYAAAQAALHRSEEDLVRIDAQLGILKTNISDSTVFMEADMAIHTAIHVAAHNLVLSAIMRSIQGLLVISRSYTKVDSDTQEQALFQHAQIVDAVHAQDPEKAHQAMHNHLLWSRKVSKLSIIQS